ncbi:hypothetical protein N7931_02190 [Catenovulum sp. 2E275]|uniref:hypothetical protein n=1 Tax=Catenovulum sp. 2E275 TaxID=2980497 RepID=UPI0021D346B9|nr:hypothetical protein [Catenovulum sp. 2E275]MCU4674430.1 hypothetical protein [Catenovulum sp. 2E275]
MEQVNPTKTISAKSNLLLISLVFILPVLLAYLALKWQWFDLASTNQGELIQPAVSLNTQQLPDALKHKWLIIIPASSSCQQDCNEAFYLASQTDSALGRETDRVEVAQYVTDQNQIKALEHPDFSTIDLTILAPEYVYIADPLGQIILRYQVMNQREDNILAAKHMLADLRKLLKLSRVG